MNTEPMINEEGHLFTPVMKSDGSRVTMRLSDEDIAKVGRGHGWKSTVKNQIDGKQYRIWAKACGGDCFCDAYAKEIK